MHVGDGHHLAGLDLDERIHSVGTGRLQDGVPGDDLHAAVVAGIPRQLGEPRRTGLRFLYADHVGAAFFTASTTFLKLTSVPRYSMLKTITLSCIGSLAAAPSPESPERQAVSACLLYTSDAA